MSIDTLIAQYLRSHGYNATAAKFEEELGLKLQDPVNHESLESILRDRIQYNEMQNTDLEDIHHANAHLKESLLNWHPRRPDLKENLQLGTASLIIYSTAWNFKTFTLGLFVTNTKQLIIYDLFNDILLLTTSSAAPIKMVTPIEDDTLVFADMTGNISLKKLVHHEADSYDADDHWSLQDIDDVQKIKLHRRLITDLKYADKYFASIGWDNRVVIGSIDGANIKVIDEAKLQTNPTAILLTKDDSGSPIIIVGRLDSSLLQMFTIKNNKLVEVAKLSLNDSEFSTHSFQPMSIVQINPKMITVGTDHIPFMRLITIAVPKLSEIENHTNSTTVPIMRSLIISNYNSMSPQDKYSSAILLTRPNSSGIWIPGDDGKLRGFDIRTGNVMEELDSNEGRAKSAFITSRNDDEIIVVAGAVDRNISIWKFS